MPHKITAIEDVRVLASVAKSALKQVGRQQIAVPGTVLEWITIRAGESVAVDLLVGLEPWMCPEEFPYDLGHGLMVPFSHSGPESLPMEFRGLFVLEYLREPAQ